MALLEWIKIVEEDDTLKTFLKESFDFWNEIALHSFCCSEVLQNFLDEMNGVYLHLVLIR